MSSMACSAGQRTKKRAAPPFPPGSGRRGSSQFPGLPAPPSWAPAAPLLGGLFGNLGGRSLASAAARQEQECQSGQSRRERSSHEYLLNRSGTVENSVRSWYTASAGTRHAWAGISAFLDIVPQREEKKKKNSRPKGRLLESLLNIGNPSAPGNLSIQVFFSFSFSATSSS